MGTKLALCSLLLHLLILLAACDGSDSGTKDVDIQSSPGGHNHNAHADMRIEQVHSHSSSHMHHVDSSLIVFFFLEDLKLGNTIPVYFPRRESEVSPHLLPREEADAIPFSSQELHYLLHFFSFPQGSPQAIAMEDTLRQCETKPIKGETKLCATSLESMLDFTRMILGSETQIEILSTSHLTPSNTLLQKYTIMGIKETPAPKMVACHTMPYPYAVFYCHYQESKSRVFRVSLTGENGDKVEAIAVCHMDTSQWSRNHVSFQVLGTEPGASPICHFFPADNFVCVPSAASMQE
ncbi:BURP domain-containing protein BNM2A-like [Sesamum indicum]|uniref:BURP domain-containing protein BNM2A-like n=1 Tax=Sesamum indicum TaxID=4182 RepID=A0A6I9U3H7_SESIN|nr:BURP domain-containing protein BNM2A-like [Sesamum indicum]